jgi:hypothetical protein
MRQTMRRVVRSTGHNSFAILLDATPLGGDASTPPPHPCVCEAHFSSVIVDDRRAFNEITRALPKANVAMIAGASSLVGPHPGDAGTDGGGGGASPVHASPPLRVEVSLGRFCLASRAWVACTLRHPPIGVAGGSSQRDASACPTPPLQHQ